MDFLERGQHAGLVGDSEAEGAAREGRTISSGKDEYDALARSYHDTVLSGKLQKAVRRSIDREGGGFLLPYNQCTKTGQPVEEVLWENHPDMSFPPTENPTCTGFEKYGEVPETVPLDFTKDDVTWVASKLSCAAGALGAEAIEL